MGERRRPDRHPAADAGPSVPWHRLQRILVVRPDNLGDVVMLTPALRALRRAAPRARLDLLTSPVGALLGPLLSDVHDTITVSATWQDASTHGGDRAPHERSLVGELAGRSYEAMLVVTSASQSPWPAAYAGLLAGIAVRVVQSREFGGAVATHWVTPPADTAHQTDRALHLLAGVGVPDAGRALSLAVPADAHGRARALLSSAGVTGRHAVLVPGASCSARRYPAERFAAVAQRLAEAGLPVVVTGSAAESALVREVVARASGGGSAGGPPSPVVALPPTGVPVFAAVLAGAAVAITNNSGGMHVADAVGTPVVALYSGTERLGDAAPRTVPAALLRQEVSCSPCRQFRCPYALECLDVAPATVAAAALDLADPRVATGRVREAVAP